MGWWLSNEHHEKAIDYIKQDYPNIIKHSQRGNVIYTAIKCKDDKIVGCVFRVRKDNRSWGYKEMSEDMHPYYYDCPESILKILSPTDCERCNQWRKNCREKAKQTSLDNKKRLQVENGDIVIFEKPVRFSNGDEIQKFFVACKKKGIFTKEINAYANYRIRGWKHLNFEVQKPQIATV